MTRGRTGARGAGRGFRSGAGGAGRRSAPPLRPCQPCSLRGIAVGSQTRSRVGPPGGPLPDSDSLAAPPRQTRPWGRARRPQRTVEAPSGCAAPRRIKATRAPPTAAGLWGRVACAQVRIRTLARRRAATRMGGPGRVESGLRPRRRRTQSNAHRRADSAVGAAEARGQGAAAGGDRLRARAVAPEAARWRSACKARAASASSRPRPGAAETVSGGSPRAVSAAAPRRAAALRRLRSMARPARRRCAAIGRRRRSGPASSTPFLLGRNSKLLATHRACVYASARARAGGAEPRPARLRRDGWQGRAFDAAGSAPRP